MEDDDLMELEMPTEILHGIIRTKHTKISDAKLDKAVRELGMRWVEVVKQLGGLWTVDSARNRYLRRHYPERVERRPGTWVKKSERHKVNGEGARWTQAEDFELLSAIQDLGHSWQRIAARLPGRTPHAIRNRVNRLKMFQSVSTAMPPPATRDGEGSPTSDATDTTEATDATDATEATLAWHEAVFRNERNLNWSDVVNHERVEDAGNAQN